MTQPADAIAAPNAPVLRVATWNMDHWKRSAQLRERAWTMLRDLRCDVVLAQETVPPRDLARERAIYRPIGSTRAWGSAVLAPGGALDLREVDAVRSRYGGGLFPMLGTFPGAVIVARGEVPDVGAITFVSVYGLMNTYSQTSMLRIIADLIPLFDSPEGEHVVLGGDFNVTTATKRDSHEFPRYEAILKCVESLGLMSLPDTVSVRPARPDDCACGDKNCRHLATYRGGEGKGLPTQLDFLYATPALAATCTMLELPVEAAAGLSDHVPIVAQFDLSTRLPRTRWDCDSFARLVAARHGAPTGRVVEDLVAWAAQKSASFRLSPYSTARLDRLPIADGPEPQLDFQLDMANAKPLQWTCGVRADGQVVIPFQWYRECFATEDARSKVLERLNAIDGLTVEPRLTGRPMFPLRALVAPGRLEQFIAVLDFIVDETLRSLAPGR